MIIIGVTGSIGTGKSTVARMLSDEYGAPVHDADAVVRALLGPHGGAVGLVAQTFPDVLDKKAKQINRGKLGKIVFEDPEKREALEAILHPMVRQAQQKFLRQHIRRKYVVLDIPLLFETGGDVNCDYTICVSVSHAIQRRRVLSRGMDEDAFERRLATQMPDVEKRRRADFVVETGLSFSDTLKQLKKIIRKIGSNAAAVTEEKEVE